MNIRTERRPGALVTYHVRVRRFDSRRGFAAGTASYCPVLWSGSLQDGENTLAFDRRCHSLSALKGNCAMYGTEPRASPVTRGTTG